MVGVVCDAYTRLCNKSFVIAHNIAHFIATTQLVEEHKLYGDQGNPRQPTNCRAAVNCPASPASTHK